MSEPRVNSAVREGANRAPSIVEGTILSVNPENHTCDVARNNSSGGPLNDVLLASLYCHPFSGEGIYFLPEPGSTCYVYETSDPTNSFVLGYVMPMTEKDGLRGNRMLLNPGDYVLSTRDDNKIVLRRGGLIQIASTGLAQRLYVPLGNHIKDFFENYSAASPNGSIEWLRDPQTSAVSYLCNFRKNTSDVGAKVRLSIEEGLPGSVDPERFGQDQDAFPKGVDLLNLTVASDSEAAGGDGPFLPELSFKISKTGKLSISARDYIHIATEDGMKLSWGSASITDPYILQGPSYRQVIQNGRVTESAISVDRSADLTYEISAPRITLDSYPTAAGGLLLGGPGAVSPAVLGNELTTWLQRMFVSYVMPLNIPPEPAAAAAKIAEMQAFLAKLEQVKSLKVTVE